MSSWPEIRPPPNNAYELNTSPRSIAKPGELRLAKTAKKMAKQKVGI
jgi:hypothetical protein